MTPVEFRHNLLEDLGPCWSWFTVLADPRGDEFGLCCMVRLFSGLMMHGCELPRNLTRRDQRSIPTTPIETSVQSAGKMQSSLACTIRPIASGAGCRDPAGMVRSDFVGKSISR